MRFARANVLIQQIHAAIGSSSMAQAAMVGALFRDAHDFLEVFLLLDGVEHECRNRFAGQSETHSGRSAFLAAIIEIIPLSQTRRTGDRPVEAAGLHGFFHFK